ncbi:MAG: lipase maturation factor family protein, partial [Acidobacteria bacterium]|nr:lipase maturation factor family protein [Acidobacteriota bacterium]
WQMWFAALDPAGAEPWLQALMDGLLAQSPAVTGLLGEPPFADTPPRRVRLAYYQYAFTTVEEGRETGNWWRRELMGYLMESERAP